MKRTMPCITCPMSCQLDVVIDEVSHVIKVSGNQCERGVKYAKSEINNPIRMISTTIRIDKALHPLLPVITSKVVPKNRIFDIIKACNQIKIQAPIQINDVIIHNPCGIDVDVIATRSYDEVKEDEI